MLVLADWAQRIVTFRPGAVEAVAQASWVFKLHMVLGMTVFLVFPFTRLVHVWSGFASIAYVARPYQLVRSRRLGLPASHRAPTRPGAPTATAPRAPVAGDEAIGVRAPASPVGAMSVAQGGRRA